MFFNQIPVKEAWVDLGLTSAHLQGRQFGRLLVGDLIARSLKYLSQLRFHAKVKLAAQLIAGQVQ